MKNILVPTDFSDCARAAEEYGLELAKKANAEIHFWHSLYTPVDWTKLPLEKEKQYPEMKARIGHAEHKLNELVKKAEAEGLKAKKFMAFNQGREEIEKHIGHHNHDFVIMGSNGTKGFRELMGSNTQKVVRYSGANQLYWLSQLLTLVSLH